MNSPVNPNTVSLLVLVMVSNASVHSPLTHVEDESEDYDNLISQTALTRYIRATGSILCTICTSSIIFEMQTGSFGGRLVGDGGALQWLLGVENKQRCQNKCFNACGGCPALSS